MVTLQMSETDEEKYDMGRETLLECSYRHLKRFEEERADDAFDVAAKGVPVPAA